MNLKSALYATVSLIGIILVLVFIKKIASPCVAAFFVVVFYLAIIWALLYAIIQILRGE